MSSLVSIFSHTSAGSVGWSFKKLKARNIRLQITIQIRILQTLQELVQLQFLAQVWQSCSPQEILQGFEFGADSVLVYSTSFLCQHAHALICKSDQYTNTMSFCLVFIYILSTSIKKCILLFPPLACVGFVLLN